MFWQILKALEPPCYFYWWGGSGKRIPWVRVHQVGNAISERLSLQTDIVVYLKPRLYILILIYV